MRRALLAFAVALAAPAAAQQPDLSTVEVRVERVAPGVAVLFGAGGNIGLSYGADGNVLIDDQYAPLTDRILAAVERVSPGPVRFVVNTHWHLDHTGGNENLGTRGAVIVAHDNVRERMSTEQFMARFNATLPASPKAALPVVTFAEGVTLHLNGDTMHIVHVANAHTDGDALVHWREANVIHMGDLYFKDFSFPFIDEGSGGTFQGLIAAVERALALTNEQTVVIPGHGPIATSADLAAWHDMLVYVRDHVGAAIEAGRTLEDIQAERPLARWGMEQGFIKPDEFLELVHRHLAEPQHSHDLRPPHSHDLRPPHRH
jgi:cyclase